MHSDLRSNPSSALCINLYYIISSITTPKMLKRLVLQVYLGSNSLQFFSAFCFACPFLINLNPSLGEDGWKGTSAMPRGRSHQPDAGGWGLTLTQAHNCTNGDSTHLHFILHFTTHNNNSYYYCYNINIRCEVHVPGFVARFFETLHNTSGAVLM